MNIFTLKLHSKPKLFILIDYLIAFLINPVISFTNYLTKVVFNMFKTAILKCYINNCFLVNSAFIKMVKPKFS